MRKLGPNGAAFREPISTATPAMLPDEAMDYYWHPDREGVEVPDEGFRRELALVSPDVQVVRPREGAPLYYKRAWLLWYRKPKVQHYLSPGWLFLRDWRTNDGEPMTLDARVFSYLYSVSARVFGSGKRYWEHCVREEQRDKAAREKVHTDGNHDRVEDYRQYMGIKNIGAGNKFALHHDGGGVPSKGHANWLKERRARMVPGEVLADEARQKEARR